MRKTALQQTDGKTGTITLRNVGGVVYGIRELSVPLLRRLLEDPAGLLLENLNAPVKISHDTLMVHIGLPSQESPKGFVLKQYRARNLWKAFCCLFRRSRALRAWHLGWRLREYGIATPRPVAVCVRRGWPGCARAYLATEWIEGSENLHLYGWRLATMSERDRLRRASRCAESLGRLLGRMHVRGISHRDLKGANLLVVELEDAAATWLIDLDGARLQRRVGTRRRENNLARLGAVLETHSWITRTICCRFVRAYAAQFPRDSIDWKLLWRRVAAKSRRMVRRKRQRRQDVL